MVTAQAFIQRAFAKEIAELESEVGRVIALKVTPVLARAALVERLDRVKAKAAMLAT
jgi:hypothetical protein